MFELWRYMRERRKFLLVPLIAILLIVSGLLLIVSNPVVTPFFYVLF